MYQKSLIEIIFVVLSEFLIDQQLFIFSITTNPVPIPPLA
jgi:hypothetical protein